MEIFFPMGSASKAIYIGNELVLKLFSRAFTIKIVEVKSVALSSIRNLESRICEKNEERVVDERVWVFRLFVDDQARALAVVDLRRRCCGVMEVEDTAVAPEVASVLGGCGEAVWLCRGVGVTGVDGEE